MRGTPGAMPAPRRAQHRRGRSGVGCVVVWARWRAAAAVCARIAACAVCSSGSALVRVRLHSACIAHHPLQRPAAAAQWKVLDTWRAFTDSASWLCCPPPRSAASFPKPTHQARRRPAAQPPAAATGCAGSWLSSQQNKKMTAEGGGRGGGASRHDRVLTCQCQGLRRVQWELGRELAGSGGTRRWRRWSAPSCHWRSSRRAAGAGHEPASRAPSMFCAREAAVQNSRRRATGWRWQRHQAPTAPARRWRWRWTLPPRRLHCAPPRPVRGTRGRGARPPLVGAEMLGLAPHPAASRRCGRWRRGRR